jgi:hypothetical protein
MLYFNHLSRIFGALKISPGILGQVVKRKVYDLTSGVAYRFFFLNLGERATIQSW